MGVGCCHLCYDDNFNRHSLKLTVEITRIAVKPHSSVCVCVKVSVRVCETDYVCTETVTKIVCVRECLRGRLCVSVCVRGCSLRRMSIWECVFVYSRFKINTPNKPLSHVSPNNTIPLAACVGWCRQNTLWRELEKPDESTNDPNPSAPTPPCHSACYQHRLTSSDAANR